MKKSNQVLGRGLGALLGEVEGAYDNEVPKNSEVLEIDIDSIQANPFQPRKNFDKESLQELSQSIKENGLLQPIVVKESIDGYILIAGERRLRASKLAKKETIRAVVSDVDDLQMQHFALIENIQRDQLNAIELAHAYEELMKVYNATHDELAKIVHKSRTHITNMLRLLQLSQKSQEALIKNDISAGHAKVMIGLSDDDQEVVINSIRGQKLNVREVEALSKQLKNRKSVEKDESKTAPLIKLDLKEVTSHLQDLGYKTANKSNKIIIEFNKDSEIEKFLSYFQE